MSCGSGCLPAASGSWKLSCTATVGTTHRHRHMRQQSRRIQQEAATQSSWLLRMLQCKPCFRCVHTANIGSWFLEGLDLLQIM